jgi:hypothetical protein
MLNLSAELLAVSSDSPAARLMSHIVVIGILLGWSPQVQWSSQVQWHSSA